MPEVMEANRFVLRKHGYADGRELDRSLARSRFRLNANELLVDSLKRSAHRELTARKVNVGPLQSENLSLPEADSYGRGEGRFKPRALDGIHERTGLDGLYACISAFAQRGGSTRVATLSAISPSFNATARAVRKVTFMPSGVLGRFLARYTLALKYFKPQRQKQHRRL